MTLPISAPSLTDLERTYLLQAFDSGWISGAGGSFIQRFERAIAERCHRRHAVACTNGTVALYMALKALGIGAGDEVIVPALTFVSPAAMVVAVGAQPVFADVTESTWTISAGQVEKLITPKTKAIIAVDIIGHPCNYHDLSWITAGMNIACIEDAAEAHGAAWCNIPTGKFGDVSTFSFFVNKGITGGEAGVVLTDDESLALKMHIIAHHGQTPGRAYWHEIPGFNFRLTNLHAAIACAQTERWDELTCARQRVANWYDEALCDLLLTTDLRRRPVHPDATESCWLYCLHHPDRDAIIAHLKANDIDARSIWTPLVDLPVAEYQAGCRGEYPAARHIGAGAFFLPTSALMTQADVEFVCAKIREILK